MSRDHKWLDFHHAAWEADLRERIAREIEAMADEYRTHDEIDSMQGEVKDQLHAAVRIARGTDPGEGHPISPDEIAADRAVIDAATGGDWQVLVGASWAGEVVVATSDGHPIAVVSTAPADPGAIADATAIAAARTGWPRALDALEVMADAVLDEMARAEKAEAAIARVRALCDEADHSGRHVNGYGYVLLRPLRAAVDGEA